MSYALIADYKGYNHFDNPTTSSQSFVWDEEAWGEANESNLVVVLQGLGACRGRIVQWGIPINKVIADVNEDSLDSGEYGLGGDWWKQA